MLNTSNLSALISNMVIQVTVITRVWVFDQDGITTATPRSENLYLARFIPAPIMLMNFHFRCFRWTTLTTPFWYFNSVMYCRGCLVTAMFPALVRSVHEHHAHASQ